MRLRYSKHAVRHIADISDYIRADNPEAATAVIARIRASAQAVAFFPRIGRVGHFPGTMEHKVSRLPYVIVYRIEIGDVDQVVILGIYHTHQQRG